VRMPNLTFALLIVLSVGLIAVTGWSTYHLLLAGAPALAAGGPWPGFSCLLLPLAGDLPPHLASYVFTLAIGAGATSGLRTVVRQHCQTKALLDTCLSTRPGRHRTLERLSRRLGLRGRLDLVDVVAPIAFCYGYLRPRVLVSTGLAELLPASELEALLLHEREHLRQCDPLKIAFGKLLVSTVLFVPLVGALYRRYLVEKELAADSAAVVEQGSSTNLTAALVRLLDHGFPHRPPLGAGVGEALETRIDALLGDDVRPRLRLGPGQLARSLIAAVVATLPMLISPLPADAVASNHNIVAGCHLNTSAR
jgi:Zn-dependent protease with chaperone function